MEPPADTPRPPDGPQAQPPSPVPPEDPLPPVFASPDPGQPLADLEVIPPAPGGGDILRISMQRWLLRNFTPLFVCFLCAVLIALPATLVRDVAPPPVTVPAPPAAPTTTEPATEEAKTKAITRANSVMLLVFVTGFFVFVCGLVACLISEEARQWILELLRGRVIRPLPALRTMDLVAVVLVLMAAGQWLSVGLAAAPPIPPNARRVISAVLSEIPFLAAVLAAIFLSRTRAGGKHGSHGIWPFWKLSPRTSWRNVSHDIGIGILTYMLTLWIVALSIALSIYIATKLGQEKLEHPIIDELTRSSSIWVTIGFVLVATIGAAFFEELLFRGVLYNVLRRYFGAVLGAIFSSALFAIVHPAGSPYLGLFALSLILTWLYDRTGRLISSMTLHAMNNLITLLVTLTQ